MRKTIGITKYEMRWQILRSSLKGKLNNDLESKFSTIRDYFFEEVSYDRWERVYNWLEGLLRGTRDVEKRERIESELLFFRFKKPHIGVREAVKDNYVFSFRERNILWNDLVKTNSNWLDNGYFHKECNDFIDKLWETFSENERLQMKTDISDIITARKNKSLTNKHKFFF